MPSHITSRIAAILASKVRVLTTDQLAKHFYIHLKHPHDSAQQAARRLRRLGLAKVWSTTLGSVFIEQPLLDYYPTDPPPNFAELAWRNQQRWQQGKPVRTTCLTATDKARAQYAGSCREPRPRELEHDIAVAELYLQLCRQDQAEHWQQEDSFPDQSGKRPDAVLTREEDPVLLDVLGRGYTREKTQRIWRAHRHQQLQLF